MPQYEKPPDEQCIASKSIGEMFCEDAQKGSGMRMCECEEHCGSSEENKKENNKENNKENKKENNKENNKEIPGLYSLIKLQSPGVFFIMTQPV